MLDQRCCAQHLLPSARLDSGFEASHTRPRFQPLQEPCRRRAAFPPANAFSFIKFAGSATPRNPATGFAVSNWNCSAPPFLPSKLPLFHPIATIPPASRTFSLAIFSEIPAERPHTRLCWPRGKRTREVSNAHQERANVAVRRLVWRHTPEWITSILIRN
jgi:hypothetical protein